MKKLFLIPLIIVLAVGLILGGCGEEEPAPAPPTPAPPTPAPPTPAPPAPAQPIKLLFGSFMPEQEFSQKAIKAVGTALAEKSGGRITVEYSWGGALGKPQDFYDVVLNGVCDVGYVQAHMIPGRFPMSDIMMNAWNFPDEAVAGDTFYEFHKRGYFEKEYTDVKLIAVTTGGADPFLFVSKDPIVTVDAIKGLKIRGSGGMQTARISALGAVVVTLPITEVYDALQKGTIEGLITAWGGVKAFKLYEVLNSATMPATGSGAITMLMNMQTYKNLPPDIQAVIEEMWTSGAPTHQWGRDFKEAGDEGRQSITGKGGKINEWEPSAIAEMDKLWAPLWTDWIAEREAKGLPAKKLVDEMYAYMKSLGIAKPAVGYTPGG